MPTKKWSEIKKAKGAPDDPVACDYCDEGLPYDDEMWHVRHDPDGIEGDVRIPCARFTYPE